jgi:hypothetical protein
LNEGLGADARRNVTAGANGVGRTMAATKDAECQDLKNDPGFMGLRTEQSRLEKPKTQPKTELVASG